MPFEVVALVLVGKWACVAAVAVTGDLVAQFAARRRRRRTARAMERAAARAVDTGRTRRIALIGSAWSGPCVVVAYAAMEVLFPGHALVSAVVKMVCSSLVLAPINMTGVLFLTEYLSPGGTAASARGLVRAQLPGAIITNATIFGPYNVLQFAVIPVDLQLPIASLVCLLIQTTVLYRASQYQSENDSENDHTEAWLAAVGSPRHVTPPTPPTSTPGLSDVSDDDDEGVAC